MPASPPPPSVKPASKADKEMLFKGVTCTLIGLVILLAPYLARSADVRELMSQAMLVGWFALALGLAFMGQYGLRRMRAAKAGQQPTDRRPR